MRVQAEGKNFAQSLYEYTHPKAEDARTVDEIVADVTSRAGLEFD